MRFDTLIAPSFHLAAKLALLTGFVHVSIALFLRWGLDIKQYDSLWYFLIESFVLVSYLIFLLKKRADFSSAQSFLTALFFYFFYSLITKGFYALIIIWDIIHLNGNSGYHLLNAFAPSQEGGVFGIMMSILASFLLPIVVYITLFYRYILRLDHRR